MAEPAPEVAERARAQDASQALVDTWRTVLALRRRSRGSRGISQGSPRRGKFPDDKRVISKNHESRGMLGRSPLLQSLQRAAILTNDKFKRDGCRPTVASTAELSAINGRFTPLAAFASAASPARPTRRRSAPVRSVGRLSPARASAIARLSAAMPPAARAAGNHQDGPGHSWGHRSHAAGARARRLMRGELTASSARKSAVEPPKPLGAGTASDRYSSYSTRDSSRS